MLTYQTIKGIETPLGIKDILSVKDGIILVGRIYIFHRPNNTTIELDSFVVRKEYRNKKIGRKIIQLIKEQYKDYTITLLTSQFKYPQAYRLYTTEGFRTIEEGNNHIIKMEWKQNKMSEPS